MKRRQPLPPAVLTSDCRAAGGAGEGGGVFFIMAHSPPPDLRPRLWFGLVLTSTARPSNAALHCQRRWENQRWHRAMDAPIHGGQGDDGESAGRAWAGKLAVFFRQGLTAPTIYLPITNGLVCVADGQTGGVLPPRLDRESGAAVFFGAAAGDFRHTLICEPAANCSLVVALAPCAEAGS